MRMLFDVLALVPAIDGQYAAAAEPAAPDGSDFRVYVFAAYGAAILLLLLFSLWSAVQVRAAERKLDNLLERLERAERPSAAAEPRG